MHQLCKVKEFQQQEGQTSFPILLLDGTGSMYYEYQFFVDAWRKIFNPFGKNKLEYQWGDGLFSLDLPFGSAGCGDITKTFLQMFDILRTQKLPKNITIIFASDGQEPFDLNELTEKIKQVTNQYIIQFISIAIGSQFPNDISNKLYLQLHNSKQNFVPMYQMERMYQSNEEQMINYIDYAFEEIKKQLNFCYVVYECDRDVKLTFVSEPTKRVTSGALILTDQEVRINGEVVQPTNSDEDKKAMIVNSVQQALINFGSNREEEKIIKEFEIIKQISQEIYRPEKIDYEDKSFQVVQEFVESVTSKQIEVCLLNSEKLTKIQSNLTNPEKLLSVVESVSVAEDPNNFEAPVILKSFRKKAAACYIKGRSAIKVNQGNAENESQCVAQIIKDTNDVVKNTLKRYVNKFRKEQPQDCKKLIREFYDVIQAKLNEFEKLEPGQITYEIIEESRDLNNILETLSKLNQENQLSWEYASREIEKAVDEGDIGQSMTMADKQDDYKHLPFFQQGKDDDDWESILIVIFDRNDMMKEYDLAFKLFNETFTNIEEEKLIKLTWRNNFFSIIDSDNQQCDKLIDILRKFEKSHKLREKKIFITTISDGQTDFKQLHKNFKSAKLSFCNIRFIYVAIGMIFQVALENDLSRKFQSRDIKGKPVIYKIPRQRFTQSVIQEKISQPFQKTFEELRDKLLKEKEKAPQRLSQVFSSSISIRKSVVGVQTNDQQNRDESNQNVQQFGEISQSNDQQLSTSDRQSQEQINQQNHQNQEFQDQKSQQPEEQQQQLNTNNKQEENNISENFY